jgi:hypothetical protein
LEIIISTNACVEEISEMWLSTLARLVSHLEIIAFANELHSKPSLLEPLLPTTPKHPSA